MEITALYASLLAPLFILLSARVIGARRSAKVPVGDGGNTVLLRRMRVHANFAEYVPFALLLMALAVWFGYRLVNHPPMAEFLTLAAERERKTALMQKVNQAYEEKNLLRLLELQIQIEQIDAAALGAINPLRLGHYNQVLTEQCAQLEHEIAAVVAPFAHQLGVYGSGSLTPETLNRSLDGDVAAMRRDAQGIEHDVKRLSDRAALKAWLKHIKVERQRDLDTDFDDLFDAFTHTR